MHSSDTDESGADKQGNLLTVEENHDCCSLHEALLQNELRMAVGSLLMKFRGGKTVEMRWLWWWRENNRNVVAVVVVVVMVVEGKQ